MKGRFAKLLALVLVFMVFTTACATTATTTPGSTTTKVVGSTTASTTSSAPKKPVTIRYMNGATGRLATAEQKVISNFKTANPNVTVDVTTVSGTAEFVTALKAKFSSGEEPDVYQFQGGNRVKEFAKAGLLYDMTNEPFMSQIKDGDKSFNSFAGKVYGIPVDYQLTGLFVNMEAFNKLKGMEMPDCFPKLLAESKKARDQGVQYPVLIAGKDINNVAQFDFQYLATVLVPTYPDYYKELLSGQRKLNDPFMRAMFDKFASLKEYMSKDALGVDIDESIKRFIRGEGVFWVAHGSTVNRIRELGGNDFNFVVIPSVLQDKPADRKLNAGLTNALSIVKSTKNIDTVKDFVAFFSSVQSAEIMVTDGGIISAIKGVTKMPDKCLDPCLALLATPNIVPHADLVWIPGIKDTMKEITQKWFMGATIDSVLDEWQAQHKRLIDSNPDFVANYGKE